MIILALIEQSHLAGCAGIEYILIKVGFEHPDNLIANPDRGDLA